MIEGRGEWKIGKREFSLNSSLLSRKIFPSPFKKKGEDKGVKGDDFFRRAPFSQNNLYPLPKISPPCLISSLDYSMCTLDVILIQKGILLNNCKTMLLVKSVPKNGWIAKKYLDFALDILRNKRFFKNSDFNDEHVSVFKNCFTFQKMNFYQF